MESKNAATKQDLEVTKLELKRDIESINNELKKDMVIYMGGYAIFILGSLAILAKLELLTPS